MSGFSPSHLAQVPTLTEVIDVQAPSSPPPAARHPAVPIEALPVLGEVVSSPFDLPAQPDSAAALVADLSTESLAEPQPAEPAPSSPIDEHQLTHRVLSDVQRQVDGMLEFRIKEAVAPLLARHTEALARELRDELHQTLKDVIARSVAQELAKLRQR